MNVLRIAPLIAACLLACESSGGGAVATNSGSDVQDATTVDASASEDGSASGLDAQGVADSAVVPDVSGGENQPPPLGSYSEGTCPNLVSGDVAFTSLGQARAVRIFLPPEPEGAVCSTCGTVWETPSRTSLRPCRPSTSLRATDGSSSSPP